MDELPAELAKAIEGRKGWKAWGLIAVYTSPEGTHIVKVRQAAMFARNAERWHAAMIVGETAQRSTLAWSAEWAVDWAENIRPVI